MLKVGLTGGIGSGKSTVAKIFVTLGIPVFDADDAAKKLMTEDEELKAGVIQLFGEEAYTKDGLNRKYISGIVFNDAFRLEQLNAIVHPAAIHSAEKWMAVQTAPYVIKEAAILFESGSVSHLDKVIGVFAPRNLRIQRAMHRDNTDRENVMARMERQVDDSIKMLLCDYVVTNDEQQMLLPQVLQLHEKLLFEANKKS